MYNDLIIDNFSDPQHVGELINPDIKYQLGNPVCGDRIELHIALSGSTIEQAKFRAWGCATSIATANIFCSSIIGTHIDAIDVRSSDVIANMLGELAPSQQHCVEILNELHQKLVEHTAVQSGEMTG